MRYLTFATQYPSHHPRKGEPTGFIEKIWESLELVAQHHCNNHLTQWANWVSEINQFHPKGHTVRGGYNWKPGDVFNPKIWTGKPYWSKQLAFADPITVLKTYHFEITAKGDYRMNDKKLNLTNVTEIALNDGFENPDDFELWFGNVRSFKGQIVCWSKDIEY
jgi:hypothetical protein